MSQSRFMLLYALALSVGVPGCASLWKTEPSNALPKPREVKIDADWSQNEPVDKNELFIPRELPPEYRARLMRDASPESLAAAFGKPRHVSTPTPTTGGAEIVSTGQPKPPGETRTNKTLPPASSKAVATAPTAPPVEPRAEAPWPKLPSGEKAPPPAGGRSPVQPATSGDEATALADATRDTIRLKGLVEDAAGMNVATLELPGSGLQRARQGDTIRWSMKGRDTSMRVGAIENGQVLLQDVETGQTLIVR